jgi:hypothetical protein
MFHLPPNIACYFQDPYGQFDPLRLVRTPDDQLVSLARSLSPDELVGLYRQLYGARLGLVERLALRAAGVDPDRQRQRFLRILEAAAG